MSRITGLRFRQCLANKPWYANFVCSDLTIDDERIPGECIISLNTYKYDWIRLQNAFQKRFQDYYNYVVEIDEQISPDDIDKVYYIRKSFHPIVESYKLYEKIKDKFQNKPNPLWLQSIYDKAGEIIRNGNPIRNPNNELTRDPKDVIIENIRDSIYLLGIPDPQKMSHYFDSDENIHANIEKNEEFETYLDKEKNLLKRKSSQNDVPFSEKDKNKIYDEIMGEVRNEVGKRIRYNFWLYDSTKNRSPFFSMRDLTSADIPLLKKCKKVIEDFISTRYKINPSRLLIYVRYPYDLSFGNLYFIVEYVHPQTIHNYFFHVTKGVYYIEKIIKLLETSPESEYFETARLHFDAKRYDYITYYLPLLKNTIIENLKDLCENLLDIKRERSPKTIKSLLSLIDQQDIGLENSWLYYLDFCREYTYLDDCYWKNILDRRCVKEKTGVELSMRLKKENDEVCFTESDHWYINKLVSNLNNIIKLLNGKTKKKEKYHKLLEKHFDIELPKDLFTELNVNLFLFLSDGINIVDLNKLPNDDHPRLEHLYYYSELAIKIYNYLPLQLSQKKKLVEVINRKLGRRNMKEIVREPNLPEISRKFDCPELNKFHDYFRQSPWNDNMRDIYDSLANQIARLNIFYNQLSNGHCKIINKAVYKMGSFKTMNTIYLRNNLTDFIIRRFSTETNGNIHVIGYYQRDPTRIKYIKITPTFIWGDLIEIVRNLTLEHLLTSGNVHYYKASFDGLYFMYNMRMYESGKVWKDKVKYYSQNTYTKLDWTPKMYELMKREFYTINRKPDLAVFHQHRQYFIDMVTGLKEGMYISWEYGIQNKFLKIIRYDDNNTYILSPDRKWVGKKVEKIVEYANDRSTDLLQGMHFTAWWVEPTFIPYLQTIWANPGKYPRNDLRENYINEEQFQKLKRKSIDKFTDQSYNPLLYTVYNNEENKAYNEWDGDDDINISGIFKQDSHLFDVTFLTKNHINGLIHLKNEVEKFFLENGYVKSKSEVEGFIHLFTKISQGNFHIHFVRKSANISEKYAIIDKIETGQMHTKTVSLENTIEHLLHAPEYKLPSVTNNMNQYIYLHRHIKNLI